jgi:hypothetical protein
MLLFIFKTEKRQEQFSRLCGVIINKYTKNYNRNMKLKQKFLLKLNICDRTEIRRSLVAKSGWKVVRRILLDCSG